MGDAPKGILQLITDGFGQRAAPVTAHTFLQVWPSFSKPVALLCDDGQKYVVKALQASRIEMGRVLVNDQVVARLGALVSAPVPHVALVNVPAELLAAQPEMAHMSPGIAHGSQLIENVTERAGLVHTNVPENRGRFARLSVLYGWTAAADHQFVYQKTDPHLVHSVDHGHFFGNGPTWTEATLLGCPAAQLDATIGPACNLTAEERDEALRELTTFASPEIACAVALPPDSWGITMAERLALVEFLVRRRDQLLALRAQHN